MPKPGDVIRGHMGWSMIVSGVDEHGIPTGGFLIPSHHKELIAYLVASIKEDIDPGSVVREAERIIEEARGLDNHKRGRRETS